ncbi:hypothetical protein WN943_000210 [Citrus x changshan-huyou]
MPPCADMVMTSPPEKGQNFRRWHPRLRLGPMESPIKASNPNFWHALCAHQLVDQPQPKVHGKPKVWPSCW